MSSEQPTLVEEDTVVDLGGGGFALFQAGDRIPPELEDNPPY